MKTYSFNEFLEKLQEYEDNILRCDLFRGTRKKTIDEWVELLSIWVEK